MTSHNYHDLADNQLKAGVKFLLIILTAASLLQFFSIYVQAEEEAPKDQQAESAEASSFVASVPDLAEIVPLEVKLAARVKDLEKKLQTGLDGELLEKSYVELKSALAELKDKLKTLNQTEQYKYNKLVDLRELLKKKSDTFELINNPLSLAIRNLGALRQEWQAEEVRWNEWQAAFLKEGEFEQLRSIFERASESINTALDLILSRLNSLLAVQERAGEIEQKIDTLYGDLNTLIDEERRSTLFNDTPPMFSQKYMAQLRNSSLWKEVLNEVRALSLTDRDTFDQYGWIIVLQAFLTFILVFSIKKRKKHFQDTERWQFFAMYPYASGIFLGYMICALIYEYQGVPSSWNHSADIIGGVSFARLMKGIVDEDWKLWFIYGLITILLITRLLDFLSVPIPVFRLYICFAALVGLLYCQHFARKLKKQKKTDIYYWLFCIGGWFFLVVFFIEIWGGKSIASYLFVSLIRSLATTLVFIFLMYMLRGFFEWLFNTPFLRRSTALSDRETDSIIIRLARFCDALIVLLIIIPATLMFWGAYESLAEATKGVLSLGFNIGPNRLTVGLLAISASILYGSFLISWVVQKLLIDKLLFKRRMEKGARISIARLIHYFIVVVGFVLAISALGIEITKLTIMVSALGVGIGFGLQGIVNNFVSGLVLLFEQPVRIGDLVEINGMWAEVKHIGIRATVVRNLDHADIIIPNADLVSNQVTNWTLGDRQTRLIIAVGVAYGSDVDLVIETLIGCAQDNTQVNQNPSPQAFFLNFGESTLDFELRVFVPASLRIPIRSELHKEIDKRFREKDITIAFPQRDLHLPGLDNRTVQEISTLGPGEMI